MKNNMIVMAGLIVLAGVVRPGFSRGLEFGAGQNAKEFLDQARATTVPEAPHSVLAAAPQAPPASQLPLKTAVLLDSPAINPLVGLLIGKNSQVRVVGTIDGLETDYTARKSGASIAFKGKFAGRVFSAGASGAGTGMKIKGTIGITTDLTASLDVGPWSAMPGLKYTGAVDGQPLSGMLTVDPMFGSVDFDGTLSDVSFSETVKTDGPAVNIEGTIGTDKIEARLVPEGGAYRLKGSYGAVVVDYVISVK